MTDINKNIKKLVVDLYPFTYSVTGSGNDDAVERLCQELDFDIFSYESGRMLNGWLIPPACDVEKAELRKDGELVYDAAESPLGVPSQSDSFSGTLSLDELQPHLFTADDPEAIPYHWARLYRPNEALWGLCMPQNVKDSLQEGDYTIDLVTNKTPANMKVLVYDLPGVNKESIVINAHNCHAYQANDDVSGIAVGIEIIKRLAALPKRRYSYKLIIAPELFGPMFWLDEIGVDAASDIKGVLLLKSVGNDKPLRLQQSFTGESLIDIAAHNIFENKYREYEYGEFRAIYGNDETVFEAPPYRIPSISLTRWPFDEYHTDKDTPDKLIEGRLQDTVEAAVSICMGLEMNVSYKAKFSGLVCLSHYGLYKSLPPVDQDGVDYNSIMGRWNRLMNSLPSYMDSDVGLLEIAHKFKLPIAEVSEYLSEWEAKCLVEPVYDLA